MKQPKALQVLGCVQMWRFFSHYGMRALLVLYAIEELHFSESHAFGVNALFIGLIELAGIFGGILADRCLGLRRALGLGTLLSLIGYISLVIESIFFFSLSLIIVGGALFTSTITALLGEAYTQADSRRRKGFTRFYQMQNLGALASTLLCTLLASTYGFRMGFFCAASGMVIGQIQLLLGQKHLIELEAKPEFNRSKGALFALPLLALLPFALMFEKYTLPILPLLAVGVFLTFSLKLLRDPTVNRAGIGQLLIYLGAIVLFFAAEDQMFSSLMVFQKGKNSSILLIINPIVILLLGGFIAQFHFRPFLPFTLVAAGFAFAKTLSAAGVIALISLAELMVAPFVYTFASEVAPKNKRGEIMGMLPLAFSLAALLGGGMSKLIAQDAGGYSQGFTKIAFLVALGGLLLEVLTPKNQSVRGM